LKFSWFFGFLEFKKVFVFMGFVKNKTPALFLVIAKNKAGVDIQ